MKGYEEFEDKLLALTEQCFAGEHDATKCAALAVVIGGIIGRGTVTIGLAVEESAKRIAEAALTQRRLHEEILQHMISETDTKQ